MFKNIDVSENKFAGLFLSILLLVVGVLTFSMSEISCDRASGFCTTKSKVFFTKETSRFKIKDFKYVESEYHPLRRSWYYSANVILASKGFEYKQEFPCSFELKPIADGFSNKLRNYINGSEENFAYTYYNIIPLAIIFLGVFKLLETIRPSSCGILEFYKSINVWFALLIASILFLYLKNTQLDFSKAPPIQNAEYMEFIRRGIELNKSKNYNDSLLAFEEAELIYNDDFMLYVFKARTYEDKKDWQNLLTISNKALGLMNNNSVYVEMSRYGGDKDQRRAELLYNVAMSNARLQNPKEAIKYYTELIQSPHTGLAKAFQRRGECYLALGMKKEALVDFQMYRSYILQAIEDDNKSGNNSRYDAQSLRRINNLIDKARS